MGIGSIAIAGALGALAKSYGVVESSGSNSSLRRKMSVRRVAMVVAHSALAGYVATIVPGIDRSFEAFVLGFCFKHFISKAELEFLSSEFAVPSKQIKG